MLRNVPVRHLPMERMRPASGEYEGHVTAMPEHRRKRRQEHQRAFHAVQRIEMQNAPGPGAVRRIPPRFIRRQLDAVRHDRDPLVRNESGKEPAERLPQHDHSGHCSQYRAGIEADRGPTGLVPVAQRPAMQMRHDLGPRQHRRPDEQAVPDKTQRGLREHEVDDVRTAGQQQTPETEPLANKEHDIVPIRIVDMPDAPPVGQVQMAHIKRLRQFRIEQSPNRHRHTMIRRRGRPDDQQLRACHHVRAFPFPPTA